MTDALWTFEELMRAVPFAVPDGVHDKPITGFSIDTRSLQPGEVFVALQDVRDGHEFVTAAFKAGAAAAIVNDTYERKPGDGALIRCNLNFFRDQNKKADRDCDPLQALQLIGKAARARLSQDARIVAVTGSAGKTGTKEMLRACLARLRKVHASEKSFNNQWGVPLTLARMPCDTEYGVFEIGMNHAGEIEPLSQMVRPHAAIITTVEAVHLEHFDSVESIADAKAEIFRGLVKDGTAIIKRDNPHFERLKVRARAHGARVISFGLTNSADVCAESFKIHEDGSEITARVGDKKVSYRLAMPGRHIAENSLAVVAALDAIGADLDKALAALTGLQAPSGRGLRTRLSLAGGEVMLIDESYNANPASIRAALDTLSSVPRTIFARRIVVLGDMLELGADSAKLHKDLHDALTEAGTDKVFACGPHMKGLYDALPIAIKGHYAETAAGLQSEFLTAIRAGDVVMLKASNGTKLGILVEALKRHFSGAVCPHEIGQ